MTEQRPQIRAYTPKDLTAIYELALAAAEYDRVDPGSTLERMPTLHELRSTLQAASAKQGAFTAIDRASGQLSAYGHIRFWQEDDGTYLYLHDGTVSPERRHCGVGSALLATLQCRIRAIAATHQPTAPKFYGANASATATGANELLHEHGYRKVWSSVEMSFAAAHTLEAAAPPDGYTLRPVITDAQRRAIYKANKTVYRGHFGSVPASEEDYREFLAEIPDLSLWTALYTDDKLAGFVLNTISDHHAEVVEVSVLPEHRRRGLARYLMLASMRELAERGTTVIRLHTDATGSRGGRQLYERIGFSALKEHYRYRKPVSSPEQRVTGPGKEWQ